MRYKFYLFILFFGTIALAGCNKQRVNDLIPNVAVNEFVYLNNPSSFNLQVQGGWIYHTGGFAGLVVYRRYFTQQNNDFVAYERACPLHFAQSCGTLKVVDDIFLECPCDGHQFLMFDGQPIDGNSPQLRFYNTFFDGSNVIQISN